MPSDCKEISRTLFDPDREDCLRAVSLAILRVLARGVTIKEIARRLQVDPSTIAAARDEENLLGFDTLARFAVRFPDEYEIVKRLWEDATEPKTPEEHLHLAAYHIDAARRHGERLAA